MLPFARYAGSLRPLAAVVLLAAGGPALSAQLDAQYTITLAGLTIGKAHLSGQIGNERFSLNLNSSLTGLAGAVTRGRGAATAQGSLNGAGVLSNGFSLSASNGQMTRTIQIGARGGAVGAVVIDPPFEEKPDRVPVRPTHKAGVADPLSALVMPSRGGNPLDPANCNRTIPVFDGSQRFDIVLSYTGVRDVNDAKGYRGRVLVCAARYVPVAGHRPNRRVTKFMAENRNMDAWLAPVNGGKVLVPYRISVRTLVGTTVIEAETFLASAP